MDLNQLPPDCRARYVHLVMRVQSGIPLSIDDAAFVAGINAGNVAVCARASTAGFWVFTCAVAGLFLVAALNKSA